MRKKSVTVILLTIVVLVIIACILLASLLQPAEAKNYLQIGNGIKVTYAEILMDQSSFSIPALLENPTIVGYSRTAEDYILCTYAMQLYDLEKIGQKMTIFYDDLHRDVDFTSLNRDRLRFKMELLAQQYGLTIKGDVTFTVDNFTFTIEKIVK